MPGRHPHMVLLSKPWKACRGPKSKKDFPKHQTRQTPAKQAARAMYGWLVAVLSCPDLQRVGSGRKKPDFPSLTCASRDESFEPQPRSCSCPIMHIVVPGSNVPLLPTTDGEAPRCLRCSTRRTLTADTPSRDSPRGCRSEVDLSAAVSRGLGNPGNRFWRRRVDDWPLSGSRCGMETLSVLDRGESRNGSRGELWEMAPSQGRLTKPPGRNVNYPVVYCL